MSYLKQKRGVFLRAYKGDDSPPPPPPGAPTYQQPQLKEDEAARINRYNSALPSFENLYNQAPSLYSSFMKDSNDDYNRRLGNTRQLENNIMGFLPQTNVLSDQFKQESQNRYNIKKQRGIEDFQEIYDPLERRITGKAFQNFGGLNNSAYNNQINDLQEKKAEGIADFINTLQLQQQLEEGKQLDMQQQYLNNLYNNNNMFNSLQNQYGSNLTTGAGLGGSGMIHYNNLINTIRQRSENEANAINNFNMSNYQNQLGNYGLNRSMEGDERSLAAKFYDPLGFFT